MKGMCKQCGALTGVVLLVGGLVHLIPQLYNWLTNLTGGTPWVQIVVGIVSVVMALMMLVSGGCKHGMCDKCGPVA